MGCCPSKTNISPTLGESNKDTKRNLMFRAGFNMGEQSYGIQIGFAGAKVKTFVSSGYINSHAIPQEELPSIKANEIHKD